MGQGESAGKPLPEKLIAPTSTQTVTGGDSREDKEKEGNPISTQAHVACRPQTQELKGQAALEVEASGGLEKGELVCPAEDQVSPCPAQPGPTPFLSQQKLFLWRN